MLELLAKKLSHEIGFLSHAENKAMLPHNQMYKSYTGSSYPPIEFEISGTSFEYFSGERATVKQLYFEIVNNYATCI